MTITPQIVKFPSSDGKNTVYGEIYMPKTEEVKGIVQLCHGMIDYVGRYGLLAEYLTKEGYIFAGWLIEGTETILEAGTWNIDKDVTLVAQWNVDPSSDRDHTGRY
jgi:uncharacterized repeat protein (TIGR02543 family)